MIFHGIAFSSNMIGYSIAEKPFSLLEKAIFKENFLRLLIRERF